jgi:DNA-binding response OmpR family regulator
MGDTSLTIREERDMPIQILAVEDSAESFELIHRALGDGYVLDNARTLAEASHKINGTLYDAILLDITLPDGDGYRLCSLLQTDDVMRLIPIIFLTAKSALTDKVLGFQVGADDFITKPFSPLELKARVDAKLRKRERERHEANILRVGEVEVDKDAQRASIRQRGASQALDLTPIEYKLLANLMSEPGRVFSRDELLDSIWGKNIHVYSRSVDTHISKLRKKLGERSEMIESVHGTGYRLVAKEDAKVSALVANFVAEGSPSASMSIHA